jgi:signal transduction histidine kinase
MRSLTWKLALAFGLVTVLAVSGVGILARRAAISELGAYVTQAGAARAEDYAPLFAQYYADTGGWEGVGDVFAGITTLLTPGRGMMGMGMGGPRGQAGAMQAMGSAQYEIILADARGAVVAHSGNLREVGQLLSADELSAGVPIVSNGQQAGTILVLTMASELNQNLTEQFQHSVGTSVLIAGIAVGALALIVAFALSLQILAPLGKLTAAARQIARGDLSQRVRVRSNDEVGVLAETFNSMAESLQTQQTLRQHLMADVAHELRTPLSVIRGNLEALLDGVHPLTEENIASVLDEVLLVSRLTEDLRELALAEAGQLAMHREPVDLADIVHRIHAGLEPILQEKQLTLCVDMPDDLPRAHADPLRVSQIFHNLLSNAIRHTPAGGALHIAAQDGPQTGFLSITVDDTGTGIDPATLPFVFERFHKGAAARRREYGGAGLGLSIVRQYVEAHGGEIAVTSRVGEGTRFTFTLPASPASR